MITLTERSCQKKQYKPDYPRDTLRKNKVLEYSYRNSLPLCTFMDNLRQKVAYNGWHLRCLGISIPSADYGLPFYGVAVDFFSKCSLRVPQPITTAWLCCFAHAHHSSPNSANAVVGRCYISIVIACLYRSLVNVKRLNTKAIHPFMNLSLYLTIVSVTFLRNPDNRLAFNQQVEALKVIILRISLAHPVTVKLFNVVSP